MKQHSFDHIIKEKALGHEAPVPADAWNNIVKNKKRRRYGAFWWLPLLLLLGLGTYGVYRYQRNSASQEGKGNALASQQPIPGQKDFNERTGDNGTGNTSSPVPENITGDNSKDGYASPSKTNNNTNGDGVPVVNGPVDPAIKNYPGTVSSSTRNIDHAAKHKKKIPARKNTGTYKGKAVMDDDVVIIDGTIKNKKGNRYKKTGSPDHLYALNRSRKKPIRQYNPANKNATGKNDLWSGRGRKKRTDGSTRIKITAPGMDELSNTIQDEPAEETVTAAGRDKIIEMTDSADKKKQELVSNKDSSFVKDTGSITTLIPKTPLKKRHNNVFIDISAMPFLPLQQNARLLSIQRKTTGPMTSTDYTADEVYSTPDPSVSIMVALRMRTGKRTWLGAGLQYARIKESVRLSGKEVTTTYSVIKRLDGTGTALVDDTVASTTTGRRIINAVNSYTMLSIPVFLQYNLWERSAWQLSFHSGLCFNIRADYQNSISGNLVPDYAGSNKKRTGDNQLTVDIFAGLRLSRSLGKSIQLFAEPVFQFNMVKYRMPDMINYKYIHRAGIQVGVSFRLGR